MHQIKCNISGYQSLFIQLFLSCCELTPLQLSIQFLLTIFPLCHCKPFLHEKIARTLIASRLGSHNNHRLPATLCSHVLESGNLQKMAYHQPPALSLSAGDSLDPTVFQAAKYLKVKHREAWCAKVHRVAKRWTRLNNNKKHSGGARSQDFQGVRLEEVWSTPSLLQLHI